MIDVAWKGAKARSIAVRPRGAPRRLRPAHRFLLNEPHAHTNTTHSLTLAPEGESPLPTFRYSSTPSTIAAGFRLLMLEDMVHVSPAKRAWPATLQMALRASSLIYLFVRLLFENEGLWSCVGVVRGRVQAPVFVNFFFQAVRMFRQSENRWLIAPCLCLNGVCIVKWIDTLLWVGRKKLSAIAQYVGKSVKMTPYCVVSNGSKKIGRMFNFKNINEYNWVYQYSE